MKISDPAFQYQPNYIVVSPSLYERIKGNLSDYFPSNVKVIVDSPVPLTDILKPGSAIKYASNPRRTK